MSDRSKVTLAVFNGGTDLLEVDGEVFERGVQRQVSPKLARRLEDRADCEVITTTPGSADDVRPPAPVEPAPAPPGPDDEPEVAEAPALDESTAPPPLDPAQLDDKE